MKQGDRLVEEITLQLMDRDVKLTLDGASQIRNSKRRLLELKLRELEWRCEG